MLRLRDGGITVRSELQNKDLRYPAAIERPDGRLFIACCYRNRDSVTAVHATDVEI